MASGIGLVQEALIGSNLSAQDNQSFVAGALPLGGRGLLASQKVHINNYLRRAQPRAELAATFSRFRF